MVEIWDAYHADGTLAGCDLVRGEPIPDGLYHLVVVIIVQHSDGTLLLMKRDYKKPSFPGYYECSAGGAVSFGKKQVSACKDSNMSTAAATTTAKPFTMSTIAAPIAPRTVLPCRKGRPLDISG